MKGVLYHFEHLYLFIFFPPTAIKFKVLYHLLSLFPGRSGGCDGRSVLRGGNQAAPELGEVGGQVLWGKRTFRLQGLCHTRCRLLRPGEPHPPGFLLNVEPLVNVAHLRRYGCLCLLS